MYVSMHVFNVNLAVHLVCGSMGILQGVVIHIVFHVFYPCLCFFFLLFPVVKGVWKQKGTVDGVSMTSPALDRERAALLLTPL